jgi:hypothetical protein
MPNPKHGTLQVQSDGHWIFFPGKKLDRDGIPLVNLEANCQDLMDNGQLFKGNSKFKNVYASRSQISLHDSVLCHVSAHGLQSLIAPASLKHHSKLSSTDQMIWNAAYHEEYDGLISLPSWEVISEDEFQKLNRGKKALHTMAIAPIKYDEHNRPKPAKK